VLFSSNYKVLGGLIKPNQNKMAVSILEALQNANYNLDNLAKLPMLLPMVKSQLNNAIVLLEKGYGIWDEVEPLLEEFGDVDNVPEKAEKQEA